MHLSRRQSSDDLQTFQMSGWWYDRDLLAPSVQRRYPWRHKLGPADNSEDVSMISQTGCTVVGRLPYASKRGSREKSGCSSVTLVYLHLGVHLMSMRVPRAADLFSSRLLLRKACPSSTHRRRLHHPPSRPGLPSTPKLSSYGYRDNVGSTSSKYPTLQKIIAAFRMERRSQVIASVPVFVT